MVFVQKHSAIHTTHISEEILHMKHWCTQCVNTMTPSHFTDLHVAVTPLSGQYRIKANCLDSDNLNHPANILEFWLVIQIMQQVLKKSVIHKWLYILGCPSFIETLNSKSTQRLFTPKCYLRMLYKVEPTHETSYDHAKYRVSTDYESAKIQNTPHKGYLL